MKIVITGGHFSPAHTVLKELIKDHEIVVVGRKYAFEGDNNESLEYKICKNENIPFVQINAGRLQRVLTTHTFKSIFRFPKGIYLAIKILKKEKPDLTLTFGGYIGLTVSLASYILKIPVVLHEQTQKAGLSARLISKFASVVCISFKTSEKYFKNKNVVLTGNPIREEIFKFEDMKISKDRPIIYITGGSTGSHVINKNVYEILDQLLENYTIVHQTGNSNEFNDFEKLKDKKNTFNKEIQKRFIISEFFTPKEVGWLFNNASLVVARAGVNTVSELIAAKAIALLIPLPHGQSNEQLDNAILFKDYGLGEYLEQKELTSEILYKTISDMMENRERYITNSNKANEFIRKDAVFKIIEQVEIYGRKGQEEYRNSSK